MVDGLGGAVTGLDEFFAAVPEAELAALPDGVSVSFELRGEGGGTWTVSRVNGATRVRRKLVAYPDCHVRCSVSDFRALVRRELDPRQSFLEGRLAIEGDVGLVLRLQKTVGR